MIVRAYATAPSWPPPRSWFRPARPARPRPSARLCGQGSPGTVAGGPAPRTARPRSSYASSRTLLEGSSPGRNQGAVGRVSIGSSTRGPAAARRGLGDLETHRPRTVPCGPSRPRPASMTLRGSMSSESGGRCRGVEPFGVDEVAQQNSERCMPSMKARSTSGPLSARTGPAGRRTRHWSCGPVDVAADLSREVVERVDRDAGHGTRGGSARCGHPTRTCTAGGHRCRPLRNWCRLMEALPRSEETLLGQVVLGDVGGLLTIDGDAVVEHREIGGGTWTSGR